MQRWIDQAKDETKAMFKCNYVLGTLLKLRNDRPSILCRTSLKQCCALLCFSAPIIFGICVALSFDLALVAIPSCYNPFMEPKCNLKGTMYIWPNT